MSRRTAGRGLTDENDCRRRSLAWRCLATSPLYAADLFGSAPPPKRRWRADRSSASNWYIRGDIGYGEIKAADCRRRRLPASVVRHRRQSGADRQRQLPFRSPAATPIRRTATDFDIGFGYRVNDWFRVEADLQLLPQGRALAIAVRRSTARKSPTRSLVTPVTHRLRRPPATAVPDRLRLGLHDLQRRAERTPVQQYRPRHRGMSISGIGELHPLCRRGRRPQRQYDLRARSTYNHTDTAATYTGPCVNGTRRPASGVQPTGRPIKAGTPPYTDLVQDPASANIRRVAPSARRTGTAQSTRPNTPSPARSPRVSGCRSASPRRSTWAINVTTLDCVGGMNNAPAEREPRRSLQPQLRIARASEREIDRTFTAPVRRGSAVSG